MQKNVPQLPSWDPSRPNSPTAEPRVPEAVPLSPSCSVSRRLQGRVPRPDMEHSLVS